MAFLASVPSKTRALTYLAAINISLGYLNWKIKYVLCKYIHKNVLSKVPNAKFQHSNAVLCIQLEMQNVQEMIV